VSASAPLSNAPRSGTGPAGVEPASHRIIHVFRAPVGGLFRHVFDLARLQAAAGHQVGIVCDASTGGERAARAFEELAPSLALGILRVPMHRNPHPSDLKALHVLAERARITGATVLHGHGAKGGVYARAARVTGADPIRAYTPHGGSYNYKPGTIRHRFYMGVERLLALRTDLFLFESEYVAGRHRAYAGAARLTRIVHNGICESEFLPVTPAADPYDLLYIGELRDAKGVPFLLEALASLRQDGRDLRLLMVGSGPDSDLLAARVRTMGLGDAVAFEAPQPIRSVLARGRIMVVPSLAESLPYVVLEAAAARHPLVATTVGGIPEIFGTAASHLVPPRDADALKTAIARVLDEAEPARTARLTDLSASVRARFSMKRMGADVLSGYAAAFRARTEARPAAARAGHAT